MTDAKAEARSRARAVRAAARDARANARGNAELSALLGPHNGKSIAGYLAKGTEFDPAPVLAAWDGPVALPVVVAPGRPLVFRRWRPGGALVPGAFGVAVPETGETIVPEVLIVPLLAFDGRGIRLGYGGGYYDRTLAALRREGRPLAVGVAFAAQRVRRLPSEVTDAPLDMVVTETGVERFGT